MCWAKSNILLKINVLRSTSQILILKVCFFRSGRLVCDLSSRAMFPFKLTIFSSIFQHLIITISHFFQFPVFPSKFRHSSATICNSYLTISKFLSLKNFSFFSDYSLSTSPASLLFFLPCQSKFAWIPGNRIEQIPDQQMLRFTPVKPSRNLLNKEAPDQAGKAKFTFQLKRNEEHSGWAVNNFKNALKWMTICNCCQVKIAARIFAFVQVKYFFVPRALNNWLNFIT